MNDQLNKRGRRKKGRGGETRDQREYCLRWTDRRGKCLFLAYADYV